MLLSWFLFALDLAFFTVFSYERPRTQPRSLLANGSSMMYGTLPSGLMWQSSGVLYSGGCVRRKQVIDDCYQMDLVGDPSGQLDPHHLDSPRQRIEFRSHEQVEDGSSWLFAWNSYYPSTLLSNTTFFHLLQVFSQADNGPVYYLDIRRNRDAIFRNWLTNTTLAKIPIARVLDTTLHHSMEVMFGPKGHINYTLSYKDNINTNRHIRNKTPQTNIMHVEAEGYTGTGGCYLKFGLYRRTWEGMGPARAWYGDYTVKRLN